MARISDEERAAGWPGQKFGLTIREGQVLCALVNGCESNRDIADHLGIEYGTAKVYLSRVMMIVNACTGSKLTGRVGLALWAERTGEFGGAGFNKAATASD